MATAKKKPQRGFKTKTTTTSNSTVGTVDCTDAEVSEAIDAWATAKKAEDKAKAEVARHAPKIREYAKQKFAERQFSGIEGNFNLAGNEHKCQFQVEKRCKARSDEDLEAFTEEYGQEATEALFCDDPSSIKLEPKYFLANQKRIMEAFNKVLTDEDFENLFTPMTYKAVDDAKAKAKAFAADAEELAEIYTAIELTTKLLK